MSYGYYLGFMLELLLTKQLPLRNSINSIKGSVVLRKNHGCPLRNDGQRLRRCVNHLPLLLSAFEPALCHQEEKPSGTSFPDWD
jgi:hypothetical protein